MTSLFQSNKTCRNRAILLETMNLIIFWAISCVCNAAKQIFKNLIKNDLPNLKGIRNCFAWNACPGSKNPIKIDINSWWTRITAFGQRFLAVCHPVIKQLLQFGLERLVPADIGSLNKRKFNEVIKHYKSITWMNLVHPLGTTAVSNLSCFRIFWFLRLYDNGMHPIQAVGDGKKLDQRCDASNLQSMCHPSKFCLASRESTCSYTSCWFRDLDACGSTKQRDYTCSHQNAQSTWLWCSSFRDR